ncbi:MAG: heparinase II/III-family protein [Spirochaetaceae bacterium]|nr:heparinase II/III-family protein [Spirochaetaceae bacterium]
MASKVDPAAFLYKSPAYEARDPGVIRQILATPSLCSYIAEIKHSIAEFQNRPIAPLPFSLFRQFEDSGDRMVYESAYFERRRRLVALGLASWLWQDREDIAALEDCIWAICDEYTWALPAHLENIGREQRPTHLDLFACETGFALAELTSILEGSLRAAVWERARQEARSRVLAPFLTRKEPWSWELMRNNWCAVCAGSVGATALYLEADTDKLAAVIDRVVPTMDRFLSSFADDGTCLEGVGYWTYGVGFFLSFSDILSRATNGRMDLTANEKFSRIAAFQGHCFLNASKALSFADGSSSERYRIGLAHFIEMKFPRFRTPAASLAAGFSYDMYGRWCLSFRDLLWARGSRVAVRKEPRKASASVLADTSSIAWLPAAQWLICPAIKDDSLAFAARGGCNDEPHNHNDIGSFELLAGKNEFLADLGCGEYTHDYFGDARYSIFCNSSLGHSLPIVNGQAQSVGSTHRAKNVTFRQDGSCVFLSMDIANAYDCEGLESLVRSFDFDGSTRLCLKDEFRFAKPGFGITERFVSRCAEMLALNDITTKESPFMRISCSIAGAVPHIVSHEHREHDGSEAQIKSIDFDFLPCGTEFSVSFEFALTD